jgi:hypothetical protein
MIYSRETLKYISTAFNATCFDTGLKKINGIENAYKKGPRGKVIAKIDLVDTLTLWFNEETIKMTRPSLLCIAQGVCDSETMSKLLNIYMKADAKFRRSINILFNECPYDMTFGKYLSQTIAKRMLSYQDEIKARFVGRSEYYICESDGYLYFSFPDNEGYNFNMYPYEVISDAKNWNISTKK